MYRRCIMYTARTSSFRVYAKGPYKPLQFYHFPPTRITFVVLVSITKKSV